MNRADAMRILSSGKRFLTLGGVETDLLFRQGFPLREFAAFEVFADAAAYARLLAEHIEPIFDAAARHGHGVLADCLVYKASPDPVAKLGYPVGELSRINRDAVTHMAGTVAAWRRRTGASPTDVPILTAADIGPRGDGYGLTGGTPDSVDVALDYHHHQVDALVDGGVDLIIAYTQTNVPEATAIARAAATRGAPIIVSATVETNGRLPDGTAVEEFIQRVDEASDGHPLFYMINCAHPLHIETMLQAAADRHAPWLTRFRGFRANASSKSHAELDASPTLDRGDPADLGTRVASIAARHALTVVGGCCGTDAEHAASIAHACA